MAPKLVQIAVSVSHQNTNPVSVAVVLFLNQFDGFFLNDVGDT